MVNKNITHTGLKSKMALSVGIVVIAAFAVYNWVVSPQTAYLHAAEQYKQVAKDTKQKTLILEKTIGRQQREHSLVQIECDELKAKFFSPVEASDFLAGIDPLAINSGCVIDSLSFMPLDEIEDAQGECTVKITSRQVNIRVTGQYASITDLIKELSDKSKAVVLSDLDLEITSDFSALTCDMNITIYILEDREINNDVKS